MRNLNARQIVILCITLLVILYGAFEFFFTGHKGGRNADVSKKTMDLNTFIADITSTLSKDSLSPVDAYMIKTAETEWPQNLFLEPQSDRQKTIAREEARAREVQAAVTALKGQMKYTGFLEMNRKRIAVINGNEYVAGDKLEVGGYVLDGIYPNKIVIYNKETRLKIDIPLQE